jgi:hypothetical protein
MVEEPPAGRIAVVFDRGSASPLEIDTGLASCFAEREYLVADSPYAASMLPLLRQLGRVTPLRDWVAGWDRPPDAVVTFSERMLPVTARIAAQLPGCFHTPRVAHALTDKVRQRDLLMRGGVEAIRYHPVDDLADWPAAVAHVGLPAVLKPRTGEGSAHTYLVTELDDARRLVTAVLSDPHGPAGFTLEQYLAGRDCAPYGDYISVESLAVDGRIIHLGVTGKFRQLPPVREIGQFWPAQLPPNERRAVTDLVTRALTALGVRYGVTHTEVKLTPDGPRIIEVNGRLGGLMGELAARAAGMDLIALAGQVAAGRPVDVSPPDLDGVYFQFYNAAPTVPCRLVRAVGGRVVRGLPGITRYQLFVKPGEMVPGGVGTTLLDLLCGRADDHADLPAVLDRALAQLSFVFCGSDGEFVHSATGPYPPRGDAP